MSAEVCGFCNGHWLDYRSRGGSHCHALRETSYGDTTQFHATPYFAHRYKGVLTGEPLGMDEFITLLLSESAEVGT